MSNGEDIPERQIRAVYDEQSVRVYQAYSDAVANSALARGTFVSPPFKMERMTWIKPSFIWMMYRAGWGRKDEGQKRILAMDITREGFDWALSHGCPSHPDASMNREEWLQRMSTMPVRIQWDPERDLFLRPLQHRTIQIGLSKEAVEFYVNAWIQSITDITAKAHKIKSLIDSGAIQQAQSELPVERIYLSAQPTDG